MSFLSLVFAIFCFVGIAFVILNLRYWLKGEEFRGGCASNNPLLKNEIGECGLCGRKVGETCKMPETHKA